VSTDASAEELAGRLDDPSLVLLDVRGHAEHTGETGYPCDPRQGHIPGSRHVDVQDLLAAADAEEIRRLVGVAPGTEVVAYCHSGGRSALAVELLRAAGYEARNYPGSWHEWSRDPALPAGP
jgi:thiosulfate/3-mercaptopyruvate sulfurtransferase